MKKLDLTDQRFGRLVVLEEAERYIFSSGRTARQWLCLCDCGSKVTVNQNSLVQGVSQSCGCLQKDVVRERWSSHKMTNSRLYRIWAGLKKRCDGVNQPVYKYYGGRGISYDPKWTTFEGFREDMKEGYTDEMSLDRIDNDKNYSKENCRWVLIERQARNQKQRSTNKSGVTGVHHITNKHGSSYWKSTWRDMDGKTKSKSFSVKKLGNDNAFFRACEYRKQMIEQLNEMGAGYSETHGQ